MKLNEQQIKEAGQVVAAEVIRIQEQAKEVANTILQQLGGNQFAAMTGAKKFRSISSTENLGSLTFDINTKGFNDSGINKVEITLEANDTYTMLFLKTKKAFVRKNKLYEASSVVIKKIENVYCDQLQDLFEENTNLLTTLYPRR